MDFTNIQVLTAAARKQVPENGCGGYALASILFPSIFQTYANKGIYRMIQDSQESYDGARKIFIDGSRADDTSAMSLPSAVASIAQNFGLNVELFYNRGTLSAAPQFQDILVPEETSFGNMGITKHNVDHYSALTDSARAHIVLVNGGTHWVAVVYNNSGANNLLYDPGTGDITPLANNAVIPGYADLYLELS